MPSCWAADLAGILTICLLLVCKRIYLERGSFVDYISQVNLFHNSLQSWYYFLQRASMQLWFHVTENVVTPACSLCQLCNNILTVNHIIFFTELALNLYNS